MMTLFADNERTERVLRRQRRRARRAGRGWSPAGTSSVGVFVTIMTQAA